MLIGRLTSIISGRLIMYLRFVLFSFILATQVNQLFCQPVSGSTEKQEITITRLSKEIDFDGIPEEEAWNSIKTLDLIMHSPYFGKSPSETSDVRIAYDDDYLYVGAMLNCEDPAMIRSASYKRDFIGQSGDWFGIILDTYNDKENGVLFLTTPDGLRIDANIQRDAVVNNSNRTPYNISWNTFWDVRTKRNSNGWSAEIRIPLSSIRFQESDGFVRMGLIIQRWIPAKNEMDIFPAIPPNWGDQSPLKPSQAGEVVLHDIKPQSPLYLTPYLLTGYGRSYSLNSSGDAYMKMDDPTLEAGLDLKYGITTNMVMDLTVNTDFAQVEADDQQINLTRFSLYFPEKRLFFLERSSVFDFSLGGNNNMFYSRRIGLSPDGTPVRIYGGARFIGRLGKWDVGFLDMQTAAYYRESPEGSREKIMPSENFGVLRLRRQVINSNSNIGTMMTSRIGIDGSYNYVVGLDGVVRMFGEDYFDIRLARSFDSDIKTNSLTSPARVYGLWERRSSTGLGYAFGYSYVGTDYNPAVGFERLKNYRLFRFDLRYGWLPGQRSIFYRHSTEFEMRYFTYANDGALMTFETKAAWVFQTKTKWKGELSAEYGRENLKDTLFLLKDEVFVTPSEYNNITYSVDITTPDSRAFYLKVLSETGPYFDGKRYSVRLQPTWNVSKQLELGASYSYDYVNFSERDQLLSNHIVGLKALFMLNTRFSANAFIQYNTSENIILTNFRLRYNPKEGNDIYLVINEGRNSDLSGEDPPLPAYNSRSILLKYTYTFNF
ncbi:MAG: carbohydrate binding family 9 domain-containing protein [Bacteroidales bacterium]|jgi:hypothetical protein|nr:carbohydrate binding family 9 domain-containing protein [Bacteroidales bacterium]